MESKADQLVKEADKSLKGFSLAKYFRGDRYESARDKFKQAATHYKACNNYTKAAKAYERAADMSRAYKDEVDETTDLEDAAMCYVKTNDKKTAAALYTLVLGQYEKNQMHIKAAKICVSLSEITEGTAPITWLEKAAVYYQMQGSRASADGLRQKVAETKARLGDYKGARELYEQLARDTLNDAVLRSAARKLFFMALLTQLATFTGESIMEDVTELRERFDEYQELDTQFDHLTREHMLVSAIIEAIQEESVEKMDAAIMDYDKICVLDELKEKMLTRAKHALIGRLHDLR
ncbi:putative SNAP protein [Trypanosoma rangeli]|uniref:Putative SNAP protein n=1 Tax=Trypanosoma rangeli TaxID=5698 RepID=A0A3R7P116_TRYRA|nr:putative SNAP protein [Trypanosoma rangeli]RNF10965.1 putative SNAP protein [Trypanosoma rangeli]|eukprot:RNF10965.1 putative SNAP protein [Trypanosoma rangeli]